MLQFNSLTFIAHSKFSYYCSAHVCSIAFKEVNWFNYKAHGGTDWLTLWNLLLLKWEDKWTADSNFRCNSFPHVQPKRNVFIFFLLKFMLSLSIPATMWRSRFLFHYSFIYMRRCEWILLIKFSTFFLNLYF